MNKKNSKLLFLPFLSIFLAPPAGAQILDSCSYAANQCVKWYEEKIIDDDTYKPEKAYDMCPVTGVQTGWRTACSTESQIALKARLADVFEANSNPQLPAHTKFMATITFKSFADCKSKWGKQIGIKDVSAQFAGYNKNESPGKICKALYPSGDNWLRECPILDCAALPSNCTYVDQPKDSKGCATGCGVKKCGGEGWGCADPICAAPPNGCHYERAEKDENGCQNGCGTLVCEKTTQ